MKNLLKALLFAFGVSALLVPARAADDDSHYYLWWAVYDPWVTSLGGQKSGNVSQYLGGIITDVRVTARDTGGNVTYLEILYPAEGDHDYQRLPPPDGPLTAYGLDESKWAGPTYADIGDYTSGEYTFAMELGVYDYGTGDWTVYAYSDREYTFDELKNCPECYNCKNDHGEVAHNHIRYGELDFPDTLEWCPSFVSPEPNSGLLLLIGSALLALRRKRREA